MKTILLHIREDEATETRFQVALDFARAHGGYLECLQVAPLTAFENAVVYNNVFIAPGMIDNLERGRAKLRSDTETRLENENVSWSYTRLVGDTAPTIVKQSRLADIIVLSRTLREFDFDQPLSLAGDVALQAAVPVLVVPPASTAFAADGPAFVTWNGSAESASALHAA